MLGFYNQSVSFQFTRKHLLLAALRSLGEDEEGKQEVIASQAAAKETSINAQVVAVLSELDVDFRIKRRPKDFTKGSSQ